MGTKEAFDKGCGTNEMSCLLILGKDEIKLNQQIGVFV